MRNETWLRQQLGLIWENFFPDIKRKNSVEIKFGRRCRNQLGSIKLENKITTITINSLFKNEAVPDYIVTATIAHELTHYAHGFSSPHRKLQQYPHQGGIVDKELKKRGLENTIAKQKVWLKKNWQSYIEKHFPPSKPRVRKVRRKYIYKFFPF